MHVDSTRLSHSRAELGPCVMERGIGRPGCARDDVVPEGLPLGVCSCVDWGARVGRGDCLVHGGMPKALPYVRGCGIQSAMNG